MALMCGYGNKKKVPGLGIVSGYKRQSVTPADVLREAITGKVGGQ